MAGYWFMNQLIKLYEIDCLNNYYENTVSIMVDPKYNYIRDIEFFSLEKLKNGKKCFKEKVDNNTYNQDNCIDVVYMIFLTARTYEATSYIDDDSICNAITELFYEFIKYIKTIDLDLDKNKILKSFIFRFISILYSIFLYKCVSFIDDIWNPLDLHSYCKFLINKMDTNEINMIEISLDSLKFFATYLTSRPDYDTKKKLTFNSRTDDSYNLFNYQRYDDYDTDFNEMLNIIDAKNYNFKYEAVFSKLISWINYLDEDTFDYYLDTLILNKKFVDILYPEKTKSYIKALQNLANKNVRVFQNKTRCTSIVCKLFDYINNDENNIASIKAYYNTYKNFVEETKHITFENLDYSSSFRYYKDEELFTGRKIKKIIFEKTLKI